MCKGDSVRLNAKELIGFIFCSFTQFKQFRFEYSFILRIIFVLFVLNSLGKRQQTKDNKPTRRKNGRQENCI